MVYAVPNRSQVAGIMADTGQGRRSQAEGPNHPAMRTQGSSSASGYARSRAPERALSSETPEAFIPPSGEEIRRGYAREQRSAHQTPPASHHLRESAPPSSTGQLRYAASHDSGTSATRSREASYDTASDMGSLSDASEPYEDWTDSETDVEMEDGTQARSASTQPSAVASSHLAQMQPGPPGTRPGMTPFSQRTPTYMNPVHGHYNSPKSCVVCRTKPVYETPNGFHPYPTCGMKCAANLQQENSGRVPPSASSYSYPPKCIVCGIKDQYNNWVTGKRYPTCGTTCASRLKPAGAAAKGFCELCRKRPKAVSRSTGKQYEFCGRQCREKSKALLDKAMEGTCRTCLICLRGSVMDVDKPYCGQECYLAAEHLAPTMIEIPRGHVMFDRYNRRFQDGWQASSDDETTIKHMYFFAQSADVRAQYANYKEDLKRSQRGKSATEKELWIAVHRECNTGDSGEVQLCLSFTCPFCDIVRDGFQQRDYPGGVTLASSSALANETLGGVAPRRSTKVLMNVRLARATGKKTPEVTMREILRYAEDMRREHSVVKVVAAKGSRTVDTGETHVFEYAAILPLGCVVYA